MKLLVNNPKGAQEIIQIAEGGGYFDKDRVLWDERTDGPLPEVILGGMVREGEKLRFDQDIFDANSSNPINDERNNAEILARLRENDANAIRSILEGDQDRIAAWNEKQAALRAQLVKA